MDNIHWISSDNFWQQVFGLHESQSHWLNPAWVFHIVRYSFQISTLSVFWISMATSCSPVGFPHLFDKPSNNTTCIRISSDYLIRGAQPKQLKREIWSGEGKSGPNYSNFILGATGRQNILTKRVANRNCNMLHTTCAPAPNRRIRTLW